MTVRGIYGNNISAFIIVYLVTCANFQKTNLSSILAKKKKKESRTILVMATEPIMPRSVQFKIKNKTKQPNK